MTIRQPANYPSRQSQAETIARLESDLYMARRAMIGLMRQEARDILMGYSECRDRSDVCDWAEAAAAEVLAFAVPKASEEMGEASGSSPRSVCPLCGDGSMNLSGVQGFAVPEGLKRHLLGLNKARQCDVFGAAHALARGHVDEERLF